MSAESLARWQFAITTVYHFFFVPVTIGLSALVAGMQTAWYRTRNEKYLRLTKFFGKLFLINFALGVVTGIVQEFQFGMNWSEYSRFVGDIFGAPLALEALVAFFLESTFLGLWIFGWGRLPERLHLMTIWLAALGTTLSAYFILAANSFMQNPVGFTYNEARGRAELTDFGAVLTNPVVLVTYPHQLFGAFMVGGAFVAGVAGWHLLRGTRTEDRDRTAWRSAIKIGAVTLLIAGLGVMVSGDLQGKVMTQVQPMKMAAAEALYESQAPAEFSVITIGTPDGQHELWGIKIPRLLSFLAHGDFTSEVQGIRQLQAAYEATFGPGTYSPNIPLTYWSFRWMIALGMAGMAAGALLLFATRGGRTPNITVGDAPTRLHALLARAWLPLMIALPLLPLFANSLGWIFTETGRQPWLVFGLLSTASGVSPGTTIAEVLTSMSVFTVLYGVLAVIEVRLMLTYIRAGLPDVTPRPVEQDDDRPLEFAY